MKYGASGFRVVGEGTVAERKETKEMKKNAVLNEIVFILNSL